MSHLFTDHLGFRLLVAVSAASLMCARLLFRSRRSGPGFCDHCGTAPAAEAARCPACAAILPKSAN